ncbi:MAG: amidophosphoribosyltransferase [Bacteroidales bacterium]|nr:amidophosphoribosyltransferase [Bacteroidales bacterium]
MDFKLDNRELHEECGVVALYGVEDAARKAYVALRSLQHRGQQGCGIATLGPSGAIRLHRGPGLVRQVFSDADLERLPGSSCIGHVRYPTTEVGGPENIQPFQMTDSQGCFALAHNGNIINAGILHQRLESEGRLFLSTSDSELTGHLIGEAQARLGLAEGILSAIRVLDGAFALVILTPDAIYACRDRYGFRPLSIGTLGDGYLIASETCAFRELGARFLRDIEPGETVVVDRGGLHSLYRTESARRGLCAMEYIYFARPDSILEGLSAYSFRKAAGRLLWEEHPVEADLVTGVPESGLAAALGFAQAGRIPFETGLIKNFYVARTFIQPAQHMRDLAVRMKFSPLPETLRGQRIAVIDDSIVRGTTLRQLVRMFRDAGAKEVHVRIASPRYAYPCYYGIDTGSRAQLIGADHDEAWICRFLGADSLGYLSEEAVRTAAGGLPLCTACFNGRYPTDLYGHDPFTE